MKQPKNKTTNLRLRPCPLSLLVVRSVRTLLGFGLCRSPQKQHQRSRVRALACACFDPDASATNINKRQTTKAQTQLKPCRPFAMPRRHPAVRRQENTTRTPSRPCSAGQNTIKRTSKRANKTKCTSMLALTSCMLLKPWLHARSTCLTFDVSSCDSVQRLVVLSAAEEDRNSQT